MPLNGAQPPLAFQLTVRGFWLDVSVTLVKGQGVMVGGRVGDGVNVDVNVGNGVKVGVNVGVDVGSGVKVGVDVGWRVGVFVGVQVGDGVAVDVLVDVAVLVGVLVGVAVKVELDVDVGVWVVVAVGVGDGTGLSISFIKGQLAKSRATIRIIPPIPTNQKRMLEAWGGFVGLFTGGVIRKPKLCWVITAPVESPISVRNLRAWVSVFRAVALSFRHRARVPIW